jgi:tetratricopeptide (TPR) repeat protein
MPVTRISASEARLGRGPASEAPESADFARTFAWAQGLSHALQERLDETRVPLALALGRAKTQRERAMAMGLSAEIEAKEGRASAAFAAAHKAEDWLGVPAPAMARVRGEALVAEWNLEGASAYFAESAALAPKDDTTHVALAVTLGGSGRYASALEAARAGLALQPRDADLLRVSWLALDKLGAPTEQVARAEAAFLERRTPDDAPAIRARCSKNVPGCARERDPVHVIDLRPHVGLSR